MDVPREYLPHLLAASASCAGVPANVLAAQLEQESGWDTQAVSPKGAQGLAQFMPATWAEHGVDGNRDGRRDPFDPVDAIHSAAQYDCSLRRLVAPLGSDPLPLILAAYNAGPGAVLLARGVPRIPETQRYVREVLERSGELLPPPTADGLTPRAARVRDLVRANFGITDIGGFATAGHTEGSDHYTGRAVDVMLTPMGPAMTSLGWRVALYLQSRARELSITYLIWQGRIWSPTRAAEGWRPYKHPGGRTDPTALHMDHVHASVR